jgi:uncharacterized glyoxalase superfamily protein PhnB
MQHPIMPSLRFRDLDRAVRFYTETLGFQKKREHPGNVLVVRGASQMMLESCAGHFGATYNQAIEKRVGTAGPLALYVHAPDLKALYERLSGDKEVKVVDPLADRPWGQAEFTIEDTEGTFITFFGSRLQQ